MANKNYKGSNEEFRVDKEKGEFVVHHTDYSDFGRRSYDYPIGEGEHRNDHAIRNSDNAKCQISDNPGYKDDIPKENRDDQSNKE